MVRPAVAGGEIHHEPVPPVIHQLPQVAHAPVAARRSSHRAPRSVCPAAAHSRSLGPPPLTVCRACAVTGRPQVSPVMTCYKLVTVSFKWRGLQSRVERFIVSAEQRLFTNFHRSVRWGLARRDCTRQPPACPPPPLSDLPRSPYPSGMTWRSAAGVVAQTSRPRCMPRLSRLHAPA